MLREIGAARADGSRGLRRWFQDDYFDLYLWHDASGEPIGFQLCYDRNRKEGAITWDRVAGFGHDRVDNGEHIARHPMTPILRSDGVPPYFRIYDRFLAASAECPQTSATSLSIGCAHIAPHSSARRASRTASGAAFHFHLRW